MEIYNGRLRLHSRQIVARETLKMRFEVVEKINLKGEKSGEKFLEFAAGQFVSIGCGQNIWRAYSVASPPREKKIELVVRMVENGAASEVFRRSEVGQIFDFKGPFGHFVLSKNADAHLVFCGTGTGIAPLRSMILAETETKNPRKMTLLFGGRDGDDLAYLDEVPNWSPQNLEIKLGFSRTTDFGAFANLAANCRITEFLTQDFGSNAEFYICGNGQMVKSVQQILDEKGLEKSHVFAERFN